MSLVQPKGTCESALAYMVSAISAKIRDGGNWKIREIELLDDGEEAELETGLGDEEEPLLDYGTYGEQEAEATERENGETRETYYDVDLLMEIPFPRDHEIRAGLSAAGIILSNAVTAYTRDGQGIANLGNNGSGLEVHIQTILHADGVELIMDDDGMAHCLQNGAFSIENLAFEIERLMEFARVWASATAGELKGRLGIDFDIPDNEVVYVNVHDYKYTGTVEDDVRLELLDAMFPDRLIDTDEANAIVRYRVNGEAHTQLTGIEGLQDYTRITIVRGDQIRSLLSETLGVNIPQIHLGDQQDMGLTM